VTESCSAIQRNPYFFLAFHTVLALWKARRIRRTIIQSQPGQIVHKTLSQKSYHKKGGWWSGPFTSLLPLCILHKTCRKVNRAVYKVIMTEQLAFCGTGQKSQALPIRYSLTEESGTV
jgi:hypothetical protein